MPHNLLVHLDLQELQHITMGLQEHLVNQVAVARNPRSALESLRSAYPRKEDAKRAMSMWKQVRMQILHNESFRNFGFAESVKAFLPSCSRQDQLKLLELIEMKPVNQHKIIISSRPYLDDIEADAILKQLSPMMWEFYEFAFPDDMERWYQELEQERNSKEIMHELKEPGEYNFSKEDVQEIMDVCMEVLMESSITSIKSYFEAVVVLQLLTGRRATEIINSMSLLPSSHPFQAQVSGLLKDFRRIDSVICIPLLAEYKLVSSLFSKVRAFRNYSDRTNQQIHTSTSSSVLNASRRLFGRRLTHTQKRNLYVEIAYSRRHSENEFLTSCSKQAWASMALGHAMKSGIDITQRYQVMNIEV